VAVRSTRPLLAPRDRSRLERAVVEAGRRARARRAEGVLAAVTIRADPALDPAAVVFASRAGSEPLYVLEQPDRDRAVIAGLGCVRAFDARGPGRFDAIARAWRDSAGEAVAESADGPAGSGPAGSGGREGR